MLTELNHERPGRGISIESSGVFGVYVTTTNGVTYSADQVEATTLLLTRDEAMLLMAELAMAIAETDENRAESKIAARAA